ncbi:DUF4214 domain-containing protein [Paenibacillus apiarius]|uniref:DUF4214 domain-containing protein n=1 Tax=Paenibacillus apiarius TaxID=46240 RepID=A0ABT4DR66_9BACL|nr:DUF4214 domain-containing protein [Paenibacillus apiarius]MCY9512577.1 DUF4214 domain-containing protein [Paenibacillus apiarius]MCY9519848.1 DUF4214 domain-containing protein [Paenibacillus apiarius]MCY9553165.1 DUF4214 domain-containing protein [Paenibacillus apiarius]MCY9559267.1 DUF4214 domain-containing protein [Paenibacillus apiarius]MCY9682626.1 DUF4214 domain-containing protein [Paenibacillus apiarius]
MALQHRVIHFIHALLKLEGLDFIRELYRQFLHREPSAMEYQHYMRLLAMHQTKQTLIVHVMCSEEAERLYHQPPSGFIHLHDENETAASILRRFYPSEPFFFVHSLYNELLCRNPDTQGMQGHLHSLLAGMPKKNLLHAFFISAECQTFLSLPQIPFINDCRTVDTGIAAHPWGHRVVNHIGIFLAYPHPLALDGEGIGRFLYRLIEGFFSKRPDVHIHIAATDYNYADAEHSFASLKLQFPGRVHITRSNNIETFNTNVPAEVWIVPIVSLELAMFLKKPYIVCLHDLVHHQFKDLYFTMYPEFCHRVDRNGYLVLKKAAAIVSNSNYVRYHHAIVVAGMPAEKTHVIRLAPPNDEYQSFTFIDKTQFRLKYQLLYEYLVFPTVLRLHKNFERLIAAFIKFRQSFDGYHSRLRLVFTDQLTNNPKQAEVMQILQHVADEDIRSSIMFIGRIPKSDLPSLYKYALGTIVPTLFEGSCPFPILESLTMGTPVAAANIEVTNEIITDMSAFLPFNPYSIEEMEAAIRGLWTYRHTLLARQQAAISGAMQRRWTDVANEYYALLQHVASTN